MKKSLTKANRIIAIILAIVLFATFLPDVAGIATVYANEEVKDIVVENKEDVEAEEVAAESEEEVAVENIEKTKAAVAEDIEEEVALGTEDESPREEDILDDDAGSLQSGPIYDVMHFVIQDVDGNRIPEHLDDVVEIDYRRDYVRKLIDGFEFLKARAGEDGFVFIITLKSEFNGIYKLISVGDKLAEGNSCKIDTLDRDEQDIPVVVEACEYEVSSQVNIGGVEYELTDEKGKSIEEGRKISYGKDFSFKLKSGSKFYNDFVDVTVTEKGEDKLYQVMPNRSGVYTIEGESIRGNIKISQEIAVGYGDIRYTGGLYRGDWEIALSTDNTFLVSVPARVGEEPQKYSDLSVPEGSYKLELKEEFAKKYKLVEPDKIYKVVKNKTTDINASIEPKDDLNHYNVYIESDLKIVNVLTVGDPVYAEMNDNREFACKSFTAGADYKKVSVYDTSDEISLDISIDDAFKAKYEIKSVKYAGTDEEVTKNAETGYYVIQHKEDSEATEIAVVVGTIAPASTGDFEAKVSASSQKYIAIDSIKASKDATAEKLVVNEDGKYVIPARTEHIYIDVKSMDSDRVPLGNIAYRIGGIENQVFAIDYDYSKSIMHIAVDTALLAGREIEFFVKVRSYVVFDDNVMKPIFDNHDINTVSSNNECYNEAVSSLSDYKVEGLEDTFYVYSFNDAESLNVGDVLSTQIQARDIKFDEDGKIMDGYITDYTGKGNITFYYQIFGDKPGKKYKIANPDKFEIILDQANAIIVFTYEVNPVDRIYVGDGENYTEVFDSVVNLDSGNKVKIMGTGMASNLAHLNIKDPSTATWKISTLTKAKSDELLEVKENDAVYLDVNDDAIKALGYKQFAIERTENGKKTTWNFVINNEKPEVTIKNLDNKTIYAGQEKSFTYEVKGSNHALTTDNVKIYKANGESADEANVIVKAVSINTITIAASAVAADTDKATYYIDVVNSKEESLLKGGKKLKLNVAVLDSKFSAKNIEYVRSDEDNIYFKVKGLSADVESLYTNIVVTAKAVVADNETINELYKETVTVSATFKNDVVIKVPVKAGPVNPEDDKDDKSTSQDYSFTFKLWQAKSDAPEEVYKCAEVNLSTKYSNRALYYETNLKVKALPASKNVYTGQKDIQIATPVFSKESSNTSIIYLKDDKGQIETNNYGGVGGNAYDPESGNLVINIPASVTPGKHVLTFETAAPSGYAVSKATLNINVKIGIEDLSMIKSVATYYLGNKDINIKPVTYYYNTTNKPMYDSYIKPSTCKAVYSIETDNEYLLPYITINPSSGQVKISKNLSKVYDRIKSKGTSFRIVAKANDYPGTEVYKYEGTVGGSDREDKWQINITTDGISDYLKNNNEVRAYIGHKYVDENRKEELRYNPTDVAVIDKNNKKRTQFTIKEANNLTFRVYRSASDTDDNLIYDNIKWKVSGSVLSYGADNYGLHINKVKPGIITVTATAADGSGNGSVTRTFEVKKDDYKLGLFDDAYGNGKLSADEEYLNDDYVFKGVQFLILPFNDAETETIMEEPYKDHVDDVEHNYKVNISGGVITQLKSDVLIYIPTEKYTKITLINNNKGSDGKKVQEDQVYTIHNKCFDKVDPVFDKVKVLSAKTVANKFYEGKEAATIRFEVTDLPNSVVDVGDGHTGYFLTLFKSYKEKAKFPKPELDTMIEEIPMGSEIMYENGKYYAEIHQSLCKEWWRPISDFVAGTYKLEAFIGKGEMSDDNLSVLNEKMIETTLTITSNNLKAATWEGGKTTKIKLNGYEKNEVDEAGKNVKNVRIVSYDGSDTAYFKWAKNKNVAEVRITSVQYDLDTLNILKGGLISADKLLSVSKEGGNIDFVYKAEDFDAIKEAVVNAAIGRTAKMGSTAQKAAAKMVPKPDRSGNYDMSKVNPVIRGTITYEIIGTEAVGYEKISNLTQNFEITLANP